MLPERRRAVRQFVQEGPKTEDIHHLVVFGAAEQFWGGEPGSAEIPSSDRLRNLKGHIKVTKLRPPIFGDHCVGALDVAVHDRGRHFVEDQQCLGHVSGQLPLQHGLQAPRVVHPRVSVLDVLQHDVGVGPLVHVQHLKDQRVVDPLLQLGGLQHAFGPLRMQVRQGSFDSHRRALVIRNADCTLAALCNLLPEPQVRRLEGAARGRGPWQSPHGLLPLCRRFADR
mmetsp:Transcript_55343/g.91233  ORF Transcript_55343/g.91233 Transcript_55343/m.91233 type:complete len:226 (+) Transcript_55343:1528-2205(+)